MTFYYALAATVSAALLFSAGYLLLETRFVRELDVINEAEFRQLQFTMGSDYRTLSAATIDQRIRDTAEAGAALFYVSIDEPRTGQVFSSRNLNHRTIPDVKGLHRYTANMPGNGEMRVGEFVMDRFDVTIATPMTQVREALRSYVEVCAVLLVMMLAVSAAIGFGLSRVLLRPLIFIRQTASRISSDNLSERIPVPGSQDELSDLAHLLNQMFDRLERSFEQINHFAAEASHELKTPLSLIRLHAERLLEVEDLSPSAVEAVFVQLDEVARLNRIIEEMLFIARAEAKTIPLSLHEGDPEVMLTGFEQDAQVLAEHQGRSFRLIRNGHGAIVFEERWLRQVWLNLLSNALSATPAGGTVEMRAGFTGDRWIVTMADEGPGLQPDQIAVMFDRFTQFRTAGEKPRGGGLGLAIARSIVALHGGTIAALNRADCSGLIIRVSMPVAGADDGREIQLRPDER